MHRVRKIQHDSKQIKTTPPNKPRLFRSFKNDFEDKNKMLSNIIFI